MFNHCSTKGVILETWIVELDRVVGAMSARPTRASPTKCQVSAPHGMAMVMTVLCVLVCAGFGVGGIFFLRMSQPAFL